MTRVHFIGIGGYSMSGLALWMHHQGYQVTGSDINPSSRTERLIREGIPVMFGHQESNLGQAEQVVYNTDVRSENVERRAAESRGLILKHRSELLAEVLNKKRAITVSGTHGKTTTTSMIGTLLVRLGWDPTVLVGGEVEEFGGNVRIGESDWAVAEADESDGTFLRYSPQIAVATNVEPEHLEHYHHRFQSLQAAFQDYLSRVPHDGCAVIGVDNDVLNHMKDALEVPHMTYGFRDDAMVRGAICSQDKTGTRAEVFYVGNPIGELQLSVPGKHNAQNALAALAVAIHLGIYPNEALAALSHFRNAQRRFQVLLHHPVMVVDDYAHHPTEIRATLEAARQVTAGRVFVLFQPQRYVRTHNLWQEFVGAFDGADTLVLTEIYSPPGESPIPGVTGAALAEAIRDTKHQEVHFVPDMYDAVDVIVKMLQPGDTVLTMGAGPVYKVGLEIVQRIQ